MSNSVAKVSGRAQVFARFLNWVPTIAGFALVASSFYFLRTADPDLWWHIKAGEIIATTFDVPRHDTYSFTAPAARWTDHEWGTNLVLYHIHNLLGGSGLTALKTLLGLAIAAVIFRLAQVANRGVHLLVFLLASETVACFALYRPQLVTYLFLALLLLLMKHKENISTRRVIFILFIFVLWANLHGGFLAGVALIGGYASASWLRGLLTPASRTVHWRTAVRLTLLVIASMLVTVINPYGYGLWKSLLEEMAVNPLNRQYVNEWASFYVRRSAFGLDGQLMLFISFLCIGGFILRSHEWKLEDIGLAIGIFALALYSVRNIPFFALAVAAPLARSLGAFMSDRQGTALARRLFLACLGITLMPPFLMIYLIFQDPSSEIRVRRENMGGNPSQAAAFMAANRVYGNLYNPLAWGGYLIWHLPPQMKISIDGRSSTVYPREVLLDTFRFYANEASPDLPLTRGADFVLVGAANPVIQTMRADNRWTVVYEDKEAIIFAGPTPSATRMIAHVREGRAMIPKTKIGEFFP